MQCNHFSFLFSVRLHLHIQIFVIGFDLNMAALIDYEAQVEEEEIIAELDQNMHPPLEHVEMFRTI
jgi:hypothetical protein